MGSTAPRRAADRERPGARAAAALLASALVNALALAGLEGAGAFRLTAGGRPAAVALARVGATEWEARRRIDGNAPAAPPAAAPPDARASLRERPEPPSGMIVSVAPSQDPRRPANARFLAERDNTVARETQWRGPVDRTAPLAARPTAGEEGVQGIPVPGEEGDAEASEPGREGALTDADGRIARARLALAGSGGPALAGASASGAGEGGSRRAGRFDPRVLPVGEGFEGTGRGSPSGDRLPGVADGDATLVNTRAFRYAAFYRRVYEAIQGEWRPNAEWDDRDPHERRLGTHSRWVYVNVVLDAEGQLRDAKVARGSGLDFLDRECLRAIAAAAPFPNPPRGLAGPDGLIAFPVPLKFDWDQDTALDRLLPRR